jgi:molybdenum cofactor synthesis domain-containing protein
MGKIISTKIATEKKSVTQNVSEVILDQHGIIGDIHAGFGNKQISLLSEVFATKGKDSVNFIVDNLTNLNVLDRLQINQVILEITQVGKKCVAKNCADCDLSTQCKAPRECTYARVLYGGEVKPGDELKYLKRNLKILVITLSDRAFRGKYADLSGPFACNFVNDYFAQQNWQVDLSSSIFPDEETQLHDALENAVINQIDIIFTLGGTGVGARDITPEIVTSMCDKIIPGIMEHIRMKYGATIPGKC